DRAGPGHRRVQPGPHRCLGRRARRRARHRRRSQVDLSRSRPGVYGRGANGDVVTDTDADAPPTVTVAPPAATAGPDADASPEGPEGWRSRWGPLLLTALVGGVVALVSAYVIWPHGTVNLDEIVYINQGRALSHGHLTLDARTFTPDFRPYLTGVARGRVVF